MQIEIDQSNKIERTDKDTIIGMSNGKSFTVIIKAETKRKIQEEFRKCGKPKLFYYRTFMGGISLMLKYAKINEISKIIIDNEYPGNERLLRSIFMEMCSKYFNNIPVVEFKSIGKNSGAHAVSYFTMRGKNKPGKIISFAEIKQLILK